MSEGKRIIRYLITSQIVGLLLWSATLYELERGCLGDSYFNPSIPNTT